MPRKQKNIDLYFRDSLGDFRPLPDDTVWERISERLRGKKRSAAVFMILRLAAGLALVTALGFVLHFILSEKQGNNPAYEQITSTDEAVRSVQSGNDISPAPADQALAETAPAEQVPGEIVVAETAPTERVYAEQAPAETVSGLPEMQQSVNEPRPAGIPKEDIHPALTWLEGLTAGMLPVRDESGIIPKQTPEELIVQLSQPGFETTADRTAIEPVRSRKSWIFGGELAPVYSYRRIASDDLDERQLSALNDAESGILAYAGGIHVSYSPSGRFSIQSGISYSRYGQEKETISQYRSAVDGLDQVEQSLSSLEAVAITNSTGRITSSPASRSNTEYLTVFSSNSYTPDNLDNISAIQFFDFVEFPLILRYKVIDRKVDVKLVGGMLTSLLVGNQVFLKGEEESRYYGKTLNVRSVNVVGTFGLGIEYPFSGDFTFNIEPRFGYYLNSIDMASDINVHPYSFGIFTGVSYNF